MTAQRRDAEPSSATTDADGAFDLRGVVDRPHLVRLAPSRGDAPRLAVRGVRPSDTELVLRLPHDASASASASIVGRVVAAGDAAVSPTMVLLLFRALDWTTATGIEAGTGAFRLRSLPAGTCELLVNAPGHPALRRSLELRVGQELDVGELRLARGSRLVVELAGVAHDATCTLVALDAEAVRGTVVVVRNGLGESFNPLEPGRYLLSPRDDTIAAFELPFDVDGTDETRVRVAVERGTRCELRVEPDDGDEIRGDVEVYGDDGLRVWRRRQIALSGFTATCELRPGRYRLIATTADGRRAEQEFAVGSERASVAVELR